MLRTEAMPRPQPITRYPEHYREVFTFLHPEHGPFFRGSKSEGAEA